MVQINRTKTCRGCAGVQQRSQQKQNEAIPNTMQYPHGGVNSGSEPAILRGAVRLRGLTNLANGRPKVAFRGAPPILAEFLMAKAG